MQVIGDIKTNKNGRQRIEAVVQTLATTSNSGETLATLAHDARNMVTALSLYCDLLEEPGVLSPTFIHYGSELRLVATASRRLVEKLVMFDTRQAEAENSRSDRRLGVSMAIPVTGKIVGRNSWIHAGGVSADPAATCEGMADEFNGNVPIENLAEELTANRNLLDALAGLSVALTVDAQEGQQPVRLSGEDLTRILVNMVKNAAETIHSAGTIHIALRDRRETEGGPVSAVLLTVEDSGPGVAPELIEKIFEPGFTTRPNGVDANGANTNGPGTNPLRGQHSRASGWTTLHRGLGLYITRSMVEAAGGQIRVTSCARGGARFEIELPISTR